ncbi:tetratricopeptide repeat protein [Poritiphilus flavus]|uniref:Tetratricopeptide repeat protein n=1 Tax=Poritiphilus flavus TaxID=2697053 RepID=A0A6L9E7E6_9FLAO|nr:tetratricopeptide repeat protein [Poritiphilus flavus]NAS10522.1 tetratricopeptide repeat protein [Poritiphilus flavus]
MKIRKLLSIVFLNLCLFSNAQKTERLDSLLQAYTLHKEDSSKVNTIGKLFNEYLYNDQVKAKEYAFEELNLSKKINFQKGVARASYHIGIHYNNIGDRDSSMHFYEKSLEKYRELGLHKEQAQVNHGIAILLYDAGEYDEALELIDTNIEIYRTKAQDSLGLAISYDLKGMVNTFKGNHTIALTETLEALRIIEELDNDIRKADIFNHLAATEFFSGNYENSLEYLFEALPIYEDNNDLYYASQALNDIGNTYFYLENYPQAVVYLNRSLVLSKKVGARELEATALTNLGKTHSKMESHQEALEYLNEGLTIAENVNNPNKVAEALDAIGQVYNSMGKPRLAIPPLNRAIQISDSLGIKQGSRLGHFKRSASYEILGEFKLALDEYKNFKSVSDSIFDNTKSQQIEELKTIYQTEKKEQQIALQEKEITVLEQKAEISTLQKILLGSLLLLSLIGFYGIRQKLKRNRLEKEKVDAELAFKKKELITHALQLAKKNETLEGLKQKAKELREAEKGNSGYQQLIRSINFDLQNDNNWKNFSRYFEEVHKDFNSNVKAKYPELTSNELRLLALLKMNLSSKEIANILNISPNGIKKARYRLRKKLDITTEDSLQDLVLSL